ncbi:Mitochondrial carnitine carrier [Yarrowia sp. C11]|nr:Mitochondrial carnitine carrier [Yarrowia sp. E02]KAG5373474.1 Mitochondrial carnitine carrier [Yarrowia sp. C11]
MSDAPEIDAGVKAIAPPSALKSFLSQAESFAAGGFGGICAVLVGHPFDLVKVRLQTGSPGQYKGAMDVVGKIVKTDGPRGFYRGVMAPLVGVTPMFAVSFWGYDVGKQIVSSVSEVDAKTGFSIAQISAAGFLSAIPTTAVAAPFERVKVILQLQGQGKTGGKQFNGALDVVKHLYREGGLKSVFKGSVATLARDGPGSALYFATYEYLKRKLSPPAEPGSAAQPMSLAAISFAGGMAGVAMWVPVFPIDTIKSVLQSSETPQSISQVTKSIYARGGIKAFFPGIGPALARSFPANAATFVGVELAHKFFSSLA